MPFAAGTSLSACRCRYISAMSPIKGGLLNERAVGFWIEHRLTKRHVYFVEVEQHLPRLVCLQRHSHVDNFR